MKRVLAIALLGFGMFAGAAVASVEDEIRDRIAPVGEICLQGDDTCGAAAAPAAAANAGPRSGEEVFNAVCTACHGMGIAGAPKFGDAAAWGPRIAQGMDTLFDHALHGFNAMPAKGGCASCPDEEIESAVKYMVEHSQ